MTPISGNVRWGIVGCGDVCEVKSGPAFQKAQGSELVAVMRRDGAKAADFAARHGVPYSTDNADELIARDDVDAVYVATPPGSHQELALKVAAAKKPCYVEKPMARSAAECEQMCQAFEAVGVPLYVAYYRRGLGRFQTIKSLLEQKEIGELQEIGYLFKGRPITEAPEDLPWRLQVEVAGAGLFLDLGSHLLDIFDYLFGPLQNVQGHAENRRSPNLEVEDFVAMTFDVATAPEAQGKGTWDFAADAPYLERLQIRGAEGTISCSCFGGDAVIVEKNGMTTEYPGALPPHVHQTLVQSIVDELRGKGQALSTGRSALRTSQVMDAVLWGYYGGRDDDFWNRPQSWPKSSPPTNPSK